MTSSVVAIRLGHLYVEGFGAMWPYWAVRVSTKSVCACYQWKKPSFLMTDSVRKGVSVDFCLMVWAERWAHWCALTTNCLEMLAVHLLLKYFLLGWKVIMYLSGKKILQLLHQQTSRTSPRLHTPAYRIISLLPSILWPLTVGRDLLCLVQGWIRIFSNYVYNV